MNLRPSPWEIEPKLKKEHLCELAGIIRDVRHEVLSLYNPEEGDGPWSLGCRVYERTINILEKLAESSLWLEVVREQSLYFLILVEGIPLRFYRGRFDNPPEKTLRQSFPELRFRQLSFDQREWMWRIAVETDDDGSVLRIIVAQYDGKGNFRNPWEVPLAGPVPVMASVNDERREAATLEQPALIPKKEKLLEEGKNAG